MAINSRRARSRSVDVRSSPVNRPASASRSSSRVTVVRIFCSPLALGCLYIFIVPNTIGYIKVRITR